MNKSLHCLRCGGEMRSYGVEKLQLGQATMMGGMFDNLMSGALEVEILHCDGCGKLEFFSVDPLEADYEHIAQTACPFCGNMHDIDDAFCPFCKRRLQDV